MNITEMHAQENNSMKIINGKQMRNVGKQVVLLFIAAIIFVAIAGCGDDGFFGMETRMIKTETAKLVVQHAQQQDELMKLYDVDKCTNFVIAAEKNGSRTGTIDLLLKVKKTGKIQKLTYEFTYKDDAISAGVKDPTELLKLMGVNWNM